jgi:hypothetical protein
VSIVRTRRWLMTSVMAGVSFPATYHRV